MAVRDWAGQNLVRNVCILAHVDHGKSSYADSLLASNNIISARLAGQLRFLDSRLDEQERGITIKSSAVSLSYTTLTPALDNVPPVSQRFTINLIDTPGHVDFSFEVSTASRLCDGALILVDAVEGVCTQTIAVLRQAWTDQLKPILVINKMDRLITEWRLSPSEAYHHLVRLLEQVNAIMGSLFFTHRIEHDLKSHLALDNSCPPSPSFSNHQPQQWADDDIYFNPSSGNVLFASAIDNWAFNISKFAAIWSKKLGVPQEELQQCLWGDFFWDPKSKKILNKEQLSSAKRAWKPMFVVFVLENLWAVYDSVLLNPDPSKTERIIRSLELKIRPHELKSRDTKHLLRLICSQWLPISNTTFRTIVAKVPDPITAQSSRLPKMLYPDCPDASQLVPHNPLERDLYAGSPDHNSRVVIYVSKMFAIPTSELPQFQRPRLTAAEMRELGRRSRNQAQESVVADLEKRAPSTLANSFPGTRDTHPSTPTTNLEILPPPLEDVGADGTGCRSQEPPETSAALEDGETLIGFARIYCGTVKVGQTLNCVLPKYVPTLSAEARSLQVKKAKVENLYMIMGRSLVQVPEVQAGHVFGIAGLGGTVLRNATLCSCSSSSTNTTESFDPEGLDTEPLQVVNLAGVQLASAPIVRVSLEPKQPSEMPKLIEGLRLLNQSDPCVETLVQDTGEHVILTAGELHLERCLRDLRERFAKIRIQASKPIVPFRETAVRGVDMSPPKTRDFPRGTVLGSVSGGLITFNIRALPLPDLVTEYLTKHAADMQKLYSQTQVGNLLLGVHAQDARAGPDPSPNDWPSDSRMASEDQVDKFWVGLKQVCIQSQSKNSDEALPSLETVWAFGPRRAGPNLLVDRFSSPMKSPRRLKKPASLQPSMTKRPLETSALNQKVEDSSQADVMEIDLGEFDDLIETAFQLATSKGPLCGEPLQGLCFSIESFQLHLQGSSTESVRSRWSQITGELMSTLQEAFRSAMLDWSPRLMLAMYTCEIQATSEVLGKVYTVISRRKGTVKSEEVKEGTMFYSIKAKIPIVESFGFNDELMKKTSGIALPQLVFDGFERIELDPFWVPQTEEELEDFGDKADKENLAKKYLEAVRTRKGMFVEKKIVQHAEKQRTLKR